MSPADHIARLQVPWALFSSKWFICLYSEVLHITLLYITVHYFTVYWTVLYFTLSVFVGAARGDRAQDLGRPLPRGQQGLAVELPMNLLNSTEASVSQVLFRVALGLLRLHEARLVARTEFSALATELGLVTRSGLSLRCHAFMEEVCGNTGSLPRARINKLKATSTV